MSSASPNRSMPGMWNVYAQAPALSAACLAGRVGRLDAAMRNRTKTLSYEATLAQLLGLIGSPVEVTITPTEGDWTASVARISGVLHRGERRRLTLGKGPEDDDSEVVFFSLDAAGTTGFAVSRRAFGGAKVERDSEVVAVTVVVAPNEVVVAASR